MLCRGYLSIQFHRITKINIIPKKVIPSFILVVIFLFTKLFRLFYIIHTGESIMSLCNQLELNHILNASKPYLTHPPTICINTHHHGAYLPPVCTIYVFFVQVLPCTYYIGAYTDAYFTPGNSVPVETVYCCSMFNVKPQNILWKIICLGTVPYYTTPS